METIKVEIADLVFNALVDRDKIVRKCTPTSGAVYLHKKYIGKTFDIIYLPKDSIPKVEEEVKKAEESIKKNMQELEQEPAEATTN